MSFLNSLVDEHLRELSGAEFKIAAYLYRKLERRQEVEMNIAELGSVAGVSTKQTYTVLLRLRNSGLIRVVSRRGHTSRFSLPAISPLPVAERTPSAAPAPPRSPGPPESRMPPSPPPLAIPAELTPKANRIALSQVANTPISNPHESPNELAVAPANQPSPLPAMTPPALLLTQAEKDWEECRQLASVLMGGRSVDNQLLTSLDAAIQHQSPKPGALLRRLQEIRVRQARGLDPEKLATGLQMLNWL